MSMDLIFYHKKYGIIEFPFNVTTEVTKSVLKEDDLEKRLLILKKYLEKNKSISKDEIISKLKEVRVLLEDEDLELDEM